MGEFLSDVLLGMQVFWAWFFDGVTPQGVVLGLAVGLVVALIAWCDGFRTGNEEDK